MEFFRNDLDTPTVCPRKEKACRRYTAVTNTMNHPVYENDVLLEQYFHTHTPSAAARRLFLYPQWSAYVICDRSYCRSRFWYPNYLLLMLKSGNMFLTIPNASYLIEAGQAMLVDTRHPHIYGTLGDTQPEFYFLHFDGFKMEELYTYIVSAAQSNVFPVDSSFGLQFESFIRNLASDTIMTEMEMSAEIYSLLGRLTALSQRRESALDPAVLFIQTHYNENITVEQLAVLVHMSVPYFSAQFRKKMGIAPYAYVIETRLSAACYILLSTSLSVESVAEKVGFNSTSSFIRTFARKYKRTPGQFRKENLMEKSDPL